VKVADLALIFRNAETHDPTAHTRPRGCEAAPAMAAMGQEHQFPPPRLSGRCGVQKQSFTGDYPRAPRLLGQALRVHRWSSGLFRCVLLRAAAGIT